MKKNSAPSSSPSSQKTSRKSILPHWDGQIYTKYAARFYDLATHFTGWRVKLSAHALDGLTPGKMLDVGCGTGYLMDLAKRKGFKVRGIDASHGMLRKAKEKYPSLSGEIILSSADALPFPSDEFDLVVASGALCHIPAIEKAADEMSRVLKPGGIIRIIDHAKPIKLTPLTPAACIFSQASGDILHDYETIFSRHAKLTSRKVLGRGGYMQRFDFVKQAP